MFFVTKGVSFKPLVSKTESYSRHVAPNLEVFQVIWYHVCPDLSPLDYVPSMLRMPTHRARARPLVVASVHLFGGESKSTKPPQQRLSGFEHDEGNVTQ